MTKGQPQQYMWDQELEIVNPGSSIKTTGIDYIANTMAYNITTRSKPSLDGHCKRIRGFE